MISDTSVFMALCRSFNFNWLHDIIFNFFDKDPILGDLSSGVHDIVVEAKIESGTSFINGSAEAKASIGKGSITVEEVRMMKLNSK